MHRLTKAQARRIAVRELFDCESRLVGKVDATADRKASVLRVHAIHQDVKFTRTMTKAVESELDDLASWLGLGAIEPA